MGKLPQIQLFFRIAPYNGGWHEFADGSGVYHADYVSGWDVNFLQNVLDNCQNDGEGAMPNNFCEQFLTYRDGPKCTAENTCDFSDPALLEKVKAFQPDPLDVKGTIIAEETKNLQRIAGWRRRRSCSNPNQSSRPSSNQSTSPIPNQSSRPSSNRRKANVCRPH